MGIADIIAHFLDQTLKQTDGVLEVSRGDLAQQFGCVPSQINYVLTTRFSPEHGYIVETKRGGGGYIRITRVQLGQNALIMHTINAIGDSIDARSATALIQNLRSVLSDEFIRVIVAAVSDSALRAAVPPLRDEVRAGVIKQILLQII